MSCDGGVYGVTRDRVTLYDSSVLPLSFDQLYKVSNGYSMTNTYSTNTTCLWLLVMSFLKHRQFNFLSFFISLEIGEPHHGRFLPVNGVFEVRER